LYWQTNAFGVQQINPQRLLNESTNLSTAPLILGDGKVLDKYDYISVVYGKQVHLASIVTNRGIYWYDNLRNVILNYNGNISEISKIKGVQSYLDTLYKDNFNSLVNTKLSNSSLTEEVHFSLDKKNTLIYNERYEAFTGFYEYCPDYYIILNGNLISKKDNNLYIHEFGNYGCYYDSEPSDSCLLYLNNQNYNVTKV
jgi:hypothetical protein